MSALGQKRSFDPYRLNVRFTPQSGHSFEGGPMAALRQKRSFAFIGLRYLSMKKARREGKSDRALEALAVYGDTDAPSFQGIRARSKFIVNLKAKKSALRQ